MPQNLWVNSYENIMRNGEEAEKINELIVSDPDRKIQIWRRITTHLTSTMAMAEKNRDDDR